MKQVPGQVLNPTNMSSVKSKIKSLVIIKSKSVPSQDQHVLSQVQRVPS